jgi:hypothetical protein
MLPLLGLRQEGAAIVRPEGRCSAAQRSDCAVSANVFHDGQPVHIRITLLPHVIGRVSLGGGIQGLPTGPLPSGAAIANIDRRLVHDRFEPRPLFLWYACRDQRPAAANTFGVKRCQGSPDLCRQGRSRVDKSSAADLRERLRPLIRSTQPYNKRIAHKGIWVEPELMAEIEYRAKSAEGKVRHPFFKGLRDDV